MITKSPLAAALFVDHHQSGRPFDLISETSRAVPFPLSFVKPQQGTPRAKGELGEGLSENQALLEKDLRHAWRTKAFTVVYQPQVDLSTHRVTAFEALLRWIHPIHGPTAPINFIAAAEEFGLIGEIGQWVINLTCHIAATWPAEIGLAVNVSPLQLQDPDFPAIVAKALRSSGLEARRLELEITETAAISDDPTSLRTLHALRKSGVRIAMDDFDAGYSGLGYLLKFPYDKIKLDRFFINQLSSNEDRHATARSIVRAVVALCHDLNISFVAEGVETAEQLSILMGENCTNIQGFFIGLPQLAPSVPDIVLGIEKRLYGLQAAKKLYPKMSLEGTGDNIFFTQIAEMSRDVIMITTVKTDASGPLVVYVNPAFTQMTGYSVADMVGQSPRILQGPATNLAALGRIRLSLESGQSIQEQLVNYTKLGLPYVVDVSIIGLRDAKGKITHFAATQRVVPPAQPPQNHLPSNAETNLPSCVDNEEVFFRRIQILLTKDRTKMEETTSATAYLIVISIDNFQLFQTRMNIKISDHVVRGVACCLSDNIRRSDSIGLLNDGTFAVYLPSCTLQNAKNLAEFLRGCVAEKRLVTPLGLTSVTISMGLNGVRLGDTVETLTLRTIMALSAAQQAGQNRVRMSAALRRIT